MAKKRKSRPERIRQTEPPDPAKREEQLLDQNRVHYRAPPNGWRRQGNPQFEADEGHAPPSKSKATKSARVLQAEAYLHMANLARAAMARFGYDGTGLGGAEGYMTMLAQRFPLQFMTDIIGKMMPAQVDITQNTAVDLNVRYETPEELRRDMGDFAVSLDLLLERDDPPLLTPLPSPGQS